MRHGLFLSASDVDAEGEEGEYFVFSFDEVKLAFLSGGIMEEEAEMLLARLSITRHGNF